MSIPSHPNGSRVPLIRFGLLAILSALRLAATPTITQHPQSTAGTAGSAVSLSVVATGTGPLTYQWRRDGVAMANATGPILTLARPSQTDSGSYDVVLNDGQGTLTSAAAAVRIGPSIYPNAVTPFAPSTAAAETLKATDFRRLVVLGDGRYYVAGNFSSIGGQSRSRIARFKADGSLDDTFICNAVDGSISDLAVLSDGRVVVVGEFRTTGTPPNINIARLNADGSLDPSFTSDSRLSGGISPFLRLAVGGGSIYVAGTFLNPERYLFKLDATGAVDSSFAPPRFQYQPTITAAPDGKLYCAGPTYEQGGTMRENRVCRLLANGAVDASFDAGAAATSGSPGSVFRQQDGRLLVLGQFTNFGGATNQGIARLNENGAVDRSFNLGLTASSNYVAYAAQAANGDLYISGVFTGSTISSPLARVKLDGAVDRTFVPAGALGATSAVGVTASDRVVVLCAPINLTLGRTHPDIALFASNGTRLNTDVAPRFPAEIRFLRLVADGKLLVAGTFSHWKGTAVPPIVRLNPDLSLDTSFRATVNANHSIYGAAVQPDGKIVLVGPTTASPVDTQVRRLNADGTADASFRIATASDIVDFPTLLPDGRIIVPDYRTQPLGLRVFAADGTTITNHEFNGGGDAYPTSTRVARMPSGEYLVAGGFVSWSGQARSRLVRLSANGALDASLSFDGTNSLYAAGFDTENNPAQSTGRIILQVQGTAASIYNQGLRGLLASGASDPTFAPALPVMSSMRYTILADDRLLVWGKDTSSPPTPRDPFVYRLLANGARDPSFAVVGDANAVNRLTLSWSRAIVLDSGDMVAATTGGALMRFNRVTVPVITEQPIAQSRQPGQSVTFTVGAAGAGALSYQWYFNGTPIAGATSATLTLPFALAASAGQYHAVVTNADGATTTASATLAIDNSTSASARLTNLSVRATVTGSPLITGFAIAGGTRELLLRGIGPGLAPFGVTGTIADPRLVLFSGDTTVDQNDNWGGTVALTTATAGVGAFALPSASLDAVLLRSLTGPYTVQLGGAAGGGAGLTEIYDATAGGASNGRLSNLSARYQVGTGADVLIAGFTVGGSGNKALLVRGVGPGLAAFGVPGTLADPQIAVYSGITRIAENNDWGGDISLTMASAAVGAFVLAPTSKDAALLISLPPGSYTVQLSGVGDTTGEGLIEIYEVP